ncbi:MAG: UvrD-helicase domain-containing protein [Thermoleophilia bacterium]
MTPLERPVCDQAVRDRVTGDLGTTFLVEASAGTGKTRVLVDRYVNCVLDPEDGAGDVRRVAAITFTEKAAGELRQRIRERFEALAAEARVAAQGEAQDPTPGAGSGDSVAIRRALDYLDDAPIGTIHGFAGRLLREYAVEAAIDPAFEQLDQLAGELERGRLWDEWLSELASGAGESEPAEVARVRDWLGRLLAIGVRLDALRRLAIGPGGAFSERYDLDPAPEPPAPPEVLGRLRDLSAASAALRHYCQQACVNHSDAGFCTAMELVEGLDACAAWIDETGGSCRVEEQMARLQALPLKTGPKGPGGIMKNWAVDQGGKGEFVDRYKALADEVALLRDEYAAHVAALAVAVADAFARWAGTQQLAQGQLDFTDLLGQLRNMLATNLSARGELQRRLRYVLVDEFQDTDPLQAESVLLLCEREPQAADWRHVELEPGKLFVVGDPKQSIYRFRRADIALYDEVKELIQAQPEGKGTSVAIEQNFRTTPALVAWTNNVFADVFDTNAAVGRQPNYQWAEAYRPVADGARVAILLGGEYARRGESQRRRQDEARAVAALLRDMRDDVTGAWAVCDRGANAGGGEPMRPPRWGDIALLVRTTTDLESFEYALRDAGIPYRVEGGKTYFSRREVADVLLCLRAVDDPSDGPAVYGALHSSLFGFSDDELFLFWAAGGRFDPFASLDVLGTDEHAPIVDALVVLRELHRQRPQLEAYELVERLLRATHCEEMQAATGEGAPQALANLEKLVERARAFSSAGGAGLGAFLRWAAEAGETAGEQESLIDDESDVVHILTIHKAKGLEYPIVVLAGGASTQVVGGGDARRSGGARALVDRRRRCLQVKLRADLPGASCELAPRDFVELEEREKEMARSEARRLLYVAATRARDRLVITLFGPPLRTSKGDAAQVLLGPLVEYLPVAGSVAETCEQDGLAIIMPGEPARRPASAARVDVEELLTARGRWAEERAALLARASAPVPATSPSALETVDDAVLAGGPGAPPGRAGALALGSAVHRVMELCDLSDAAGLSDLAEEAAAEVGRPDLAGEVAALASACWRAAPVRAAACATECYRELAVGACLEGVIVNGAVDLLYRDGDAWVIVDYKTDRASTAETLRARYTPQGAAYAVALEAATATPVREVVFLAAAAELEIHVSVDDALRARARADIAAAGRRGSPVVPLDSAG